MWAATEEQHLEIHIGRHPNLELVSIFFMRFWSVAVKGNMIDGATLSGPFSAVSSSIYLVEKEQIEKMRRYQAIVTSFSSLQKMTRRK